MVMLYTRRYDSIPLHVRMNVDNILCSTFFFLPPTGSFE